MGWKEVVEVNSPHIFWSNIHSYQVRQNKESGPGEKDPLKEFVGDFSFGCHNFGIRITPSIIPSLFLEMPLSLY